MKTNMTINRWQDSIRDLPWSPKGADTSAVTALSQFYWHGVPKHEAIEFILSLPAASWLRATPSLLFEAWQHVEQQMTGDSFVLLELEPIFDTAA
jgi:hypothetical protein